MTNRMHEPLMRPLRFIEPACYEMMLEQLAVKHLHAFDVHASALKREEGLTISVRYGEGPVEKKAIFTQELVDKQDSSIKDFFAGVAEDCKKTLIADYYKMMKV